MEEFKSNKNFQKMKSRKENLWHYLKLKMLMSILNGNLVSRCVKMIKDGNSSG